MTKAAKADVAISADTSPRRRTAPAALPELALAQEKTKLNEVAYQLLEEAIVTLKIPPGALVSEQRLCELTGIGRTPLREAIQRLAREHLILIMPQRGLQISPIDVAKQLLLLEARRELERLICRGAARRATAGERKQFVRLAGDFTAAAVKNNDAAFLRADREFNELCLVSARNEFATAAMRALHGLSRRFWYMHYRQAADLPVIARLHAEVAQAIGKGEVAQAGRALDRLIDNVTAFTRATLDVDI